MTIQLKNKMKNYRLYHLIVWVRAETLNTCLASQSLQLLLSLGM